MAYEVAAIVVFKVTGEGLFDGSDFCSAQFCHEFAVAQAIHVAQFCPDTAEVATVTLGGTPGVVVDGGNNVVFIVVLILGFVALLVGDSGDVAVFVKFVNDGVGVADFINQGFVGRIRYRLMGPLGDFSAFFVQFVVAIV